MGLSKWDHVHTLHAPQKPVCRNRSLNPFESAVGLNLEEDDKEEMDCGEDPEDWGWGTFAFKFCQASNERHG